MTEEKPTSPTFWDELRRRKVVRVAIAYLIVGWLLIQIADVTLEPLHLPEWADTLVIWLIGLGFPIALVLAWTLDVTPAGVEVTQSIKADKPQPISDASIAVLPFVNFSGNADNEYFSDGISEELLGLLSRLQHLRVCSRTSSFALKGTASDMSSIGRQLGVRYVLEGSVRRAGDRVRITAQLIDANDDSHLWSGNYDRELKDIFAVQDEIAGSIFSALKLTLTADEKQAIQSTTENVDALDCYLQGREQYHRSEPGHLAKAQELFEKAIIIDPDYALAWAGLTYIYVDTYWYKDKRREWIERAHEASIKAVELAPYLAESHGARGYAHSVDEQFDEAEAEFERAIELNPRLFEPIHFYAQMARSLSQFDKAAELFVRAADARPEDYQAMALAANMYESLGDEERLVQAEIETVERAKQALQLNPQDSRALILGAVCMRRPEDRPTAFEWAERAYEIDPNSPSTTYNSACLFARHGDIERAMDYIEKTIELGGRRKSNYETDVDFVRLRDNPRFQELMRRI